MVSWRSLSEDDPRLNQKVEEVLLRAGMVA